MITPFKQFASLHEAVAEIIDDKVDTVTFDVPLMIRIFEVVREDVKTDADLHSLVEKIVALKNRGTLTMDDYPEIVPAEKENE